MSSLTRRIGRNSFWKLAGDGSRGLTALFLLLVARHYGPAAFGVFSMLYAAAIFFSIAADAGINMLATRQIAAHRADAARTGEYLRTFLACKLALLPLWLLIPFVWRRYWGYHGVSLFFVLALAAAFAARNLLEFFGSIFSGFEEMQWEAASKLAANALTLGAGLIFMAQGRSVDWMAAAMLAGYASGAVLGAAWCRRKWRIFPLSFHPAGLSILYKEALPVLLGGSFAALLTKWNTLAMGILGVADLQIGLFGASEKVVAALEVVPAIITAASYPIFSDLHRNDPGRFARAQNRLLRLFLAAGGMAAVGVIAFHAPLIRALYGVPYAGAGTALCLLALGMVTAYPNALLMNLLVASGRSWRAFAASAVALSANIGLTWILIRAWGMPGSAAASSVAQGLFFACAMVFVLESGATRTSPKAL